MRIIYYAKLTSILVVLVVMTACGTGVSSTSGTSNTGREAAGSNIQTTGKPEKPVVKEAIEPEKIEEGIWIKKYPENYTCFKFKTPLGTRIITDPYKMDEESYASVVTESHSHADHNDDSLLKGTYKLITEPGEWIINDVRITGVEGQHNQAPGYGPMFGMGTNNIYVFDFKDIRLAQFASQGNMPSNEMFDKIGRVDVLVLQLWSGGTKLSLSECKNITDRVGARIIIPAHGIQSLKEKYTEMIGADMEFVENGEYIVTREKLDNLDKPLVLVMDN